MGFQVKEQTHELTPDVETWPMLAPKDGCDPLTVTVKARFTLDEVRRLPVITTESQNTEVCPAIASYILGWNCEALNIETGQVEPVPPPAQAGWEIFSAVDSAIWVWLGVELRLLHLGGIDRKKEPRRSSATPATKNAKGATSRARNTASSRRQSQPITT